MPALTDHDLLGELYFPSTAREVARTLDAPVEDILTRLLELAADGLVGPERVGQPPPYDADTLLVATKQGLLHSVGGS